jgi:glutamate-1-semialdehyde 2,1-aminomutase
MAVTAIEEAYRRRTPRSGELMLRAEAVMPAGSTRSFGYFTPYPVVFDHAEGSLLVDLDGNTYVDLVNNGLSLIHGHLYPPVTSAIRAMMERGTAWVGANDQQIEFAELLCARIASFEQVRFTNTGTEAGMLAVKIARGYTGRPVIVKAWAGYHGSYDDLEVGLNGQGEIEGRVLLGHHGDVASFERLFKAAGDQIAAVVLEPVMFTGIVTPPTPGFLTDVQELCRRHGALFIIDDCLMLRLALGGSAEKYGLEPDLTFLGKFVGGGLPAGVVGGRRDIMSVLDPRGPHPLYHGGSFNGNLLAATAGKVAMQELTAGRITRMDHQTAQIRSALEERAQTAGLPFSISSEGSVMGVYATDHIPGPVEPMNDGGRSRQLHLAALNHGVFIGPGGEISMSTVLGEDDVDRVIEGLGAAIEDVAEVISTTRA